MSEQMHHPYAPSQPPGQPPNQPPNEAQYEGQNQAQPPYAPLAGPGHPYPYPAPGQVWNQAGQQPFGAPPRQRNGLAVTAIVMSAVALLASLGVVAFIAVGVAGGGSGVLTGQVAPAGGAVSSGVLVPALTTVIEDDGGSVEQVSCPDSSAVGQGLVTVCHGSVDGFDWTGIVVFEDSSGTFTLQEL
ncbi:hypothetical protein GCM10025782_06000 [Pedococcus ginsenosidimutans]|jgi:hypothetical protein|uniref:DUF4333 domain-containing protein n=1 Tax=Pedococcus ginsenosidimutans TaxID=490570 RepID=A0ABP8XQL9_9MICO